MANSIESRRKRKVTASSFLYVPCRVEPGMFKGEYLVHADAIDPDKPSNTIGVQVLVDSYLVKGLAATPEHGKPAPGLLRVAVASVSKGFATVVLPQPGIPVGEAMLVKADSLVD